MPTSEITAGSAGGEQRALVHPAGPGPDTRIVDPTNNRTLFTYFSEFETDTWTGSIYIEVILLCFILVVALVGNIMVIVIVSKFRKMRTTTNLLIASLAGSDIVFALGIPLIITTRITVHWYLGDATCKLLSYIQFLSGTNSILTMMLISLDRYKTICHPHMKKLSLKRILIVIVFVWTFNAAFCVPIATGFQVRDILYHDQRYVFCGMRWPDNFNPYIYLGAMLVLLFILPLIVITCNYVNIFVAVRRANKRVLRTRSLSALDQAATPRDSQVNLPHTRSLQVFEDPQQQQQQQQGNNNKSVKVSFLVQGPSSPSLSPVMAGEAGVEGGGGETSNHLQVPMLGATHSQHHGTVAAEEREAQHVSGGPSGALAISLNDVSAASTSGYNSCSMHLTNSSTSEHTTSTPVPSPNTQRRDLPPHSATAATHKVDWRLGGGAESSVSEEEDVVRQLEQDDGDDNQDARNANSRGGFASRSLPHVIVSDSNGKLHSDHTNSTKHKKNGKKIKGLAANRRSSGRFSSIGLGNGLRANESNSNLYSSQLGGSSIAKVQIKLIKMLVLIVVLYIAMFTPFFILINLILATKLHITSTDWTWCIICCLANTPQNPIIYGYFNENFRKAFKQIFKSCQNRRKALAKASPSRSQPKAQNAI